MLKRLILLSLQLLVTNAFAGENILDVSLLHQSPTSLTQYLAVLEDTTTKLTFDDVQKKELTAHFKTNLPASESLNISYTTSAYWLKLHLKNGSEKPIERMLEIAYPMLANIDFYNETQTIQTGYARPFANRPYKNRFFVFPISLPAQTDSVIYLRIETPNAMNIPVKLWEPTDFYAHQLKDYSIQMLFLGIAIAMAIFNILLFFSLKDVNYLLYVGKIVCYELSLIPLIGLDNQLLWGDIPFLTKVCSMCSGSLGLAIIPLFMQRILNTATVAPKMDKLLKGLNVLLIVMAIAAFFAFQFFAKITAIIHAIAPILMLGILITCCVITKQRSHYLLLLAFMPSMLAMFAVLLRILGILPNTTITMMGGQIASTLEHLLLAFVLADRYKTIRVEKEKTQQLLVETLQSSELVLEAKVQERTHELQITSEKLEQLIEKKRENLAEKSHFLAMLTHELKSPIATIELAAQNIERNQNAQINQLSLKHIQAATRDMATITERCLQADKLEQTNLPLNVSTFPLYTLIQDRRSQGQFLTPDEATRLQIDISPQLLITSDQLLCRIIISNLIENALKYSPAKSLVFISANYDEQKSVLFISVLNEVGKAGKPDATKIFEKYYRSPDAQRLRGTGLGLWLVQGIAMQLGGRIDYVDHNNKVEFQLWLPQ